MRPSSGAVWCRAASGSSWAPAARASSAARPRRTRPSSPSKTTTPSATRARSAAAAARGVEPALAAGPPVGDGEHERAALGVAAALGRDELGGAVQPGGERRGAAGGQRVEHGGRALDAARRRQRDMRAGAAEGHERDAVAAAVGVEEQAEDRALHRGHPPPRAHRAAGVDAEDDEVALAPGADVLAQVARRQRRAARDRAPRRGGAQARRDGEVGDGAGRAGGCRPAGPRRRWRGCGGRRRRGRRRRG